MNLKYILKNFPLRVAITDFCNLKCFFCSNEGMPPDQKNQKSIDLNSLKFLISILVKNGLENLSLTGGEPALYPKLKELLLFLSTIPIKNKFFHTNGIELNEDLISKGLKKFTKIAISIHTVDQNVWQKITGGSVFQFKKLQSNLKFLGKMKFGPKVEIKHVVIRNFNDSPEILRELLDFCAKNNFKFKFLNFEPIQNNQKDLVVPFHELRKKLENLDCKFLNLQGPFRSQSDYLPVLWYQYKNTKGVVIEIGCGDPKVCKACFNSNEIFVTSTLTIKPCHMASQIIDLTDIVKNKDEKRLCEVIVKSREILTMMPGKNKCYWQE